MINFIFNIFESWPQILLNPKFRLEFSRNLWTWKHLKLRARFSPQKSIFFCKKKDIFPFDEKKNRFFCKKFIYNMNQGTHADDVGTMRGGESWG